MNSDFSFNPSVKVFLLQHYTKPTHTSHSRTRDFSRVAQDLSHRVNRNRCVSRNSRSHIYHSMSHAPSLLFPSHLSTTSPSTCTPVRPSIRPSTEPSLLSTSHGDLPCADPSNVPFGLLAEPHSPTCRGCCSWRAPFPAVRSVLVDLVEHLKAQPLHLAQAPLHAPSPFCPPLVQNVEEPVAYDAVGVDFAAFCRAAAGLGGDQGHKEC